MNIRSTANTSTLQSNAQSQDTPHVSAQSVNELNFEQRNLILAAHRKFHTGFQTPDKFGKDNCHTQALQQASNNKLEKSPSPVKFDFNSNRGKFQQFPTQSKREQHCNKNSLLPSGQKLLNQQYKTPNKRYSEDQQKSPPSGNINEASTLRITKCGKDENCNKFDKSSEDADATKSKKQRRNRKNRQQSVVSQDLIELNEQTDEKIKQIFNQTSPLKSTEKFQDCTNQNRCHHQRLSPQKMIQKFTQKQRIQYFTIEVAAKKIQRIFRAYLVWRLIKKQNDQSIQKKRQYKLQRILACKIIVKRVKQWLQYKKAKDIRKRIIMKVIKVQRWYKNIRMRRFVVKKIKAKKLIYSLFSGWRTRKIVNSLAKEIQDYVNCEDEMIKTRLKKKFFILYENVQQNKLWLDKNLYRLQRIQNLQQSQSRAASQAKQRISELNQNILTQKKTPTATTNKIQSRRETKKSVDISRNNGRVQQLINNGSIQQQQQQQSATQLSQRRRTKSGEYKTLLKNCSHNPIIRQPSPNSSALSKQYTTTSQQTKDLQSMLNQTQVTKSRPPKTHTAFIEKRSSTRDHSNSSSHRMSQKSLTVNQQPIVVQQQNTQTAPLPTGLSSRNFDQNLRKQMHNVTTRIDCWRDKPKLLPNTASQNFNKSASSSNQTALNSTSATNTSQRVPGHSKTHSMQQFGPCDESINAINNEQKDKDQNNLPEFKKCLKDIEGIMDELHEKQKQLALGNSSSSLSIGSKQKLNYKFNKLIGELKDQYQIVSCSLGKQ